MLHNLYEIKVPLIQKKEVAVSLKIWGGQVGIFLKVILTYQNSVT